MLGRCYPWFLLVFLSLVWGSSFILIKRGLEGFTPMEVGALRIAMAGAVMLPFGIVQLRRTQREHLKYILLVGVIGNAIPSVLFSKAELHLPSSTVGVLNGLQPLFTLLIGAIVFHAAIHRKQYAGVAIGFAGAFLLAARNGGEGSVAENLTYGSLIVVATMMYGLSVNTIRSKLQSLRALQITSISLSAVAIPSICYVLASGTLSKLQTVPAAPAALGYIAILGVVGTALAAVLFNKLIQMRGLMMATSVPYIIPIVAIGWGLVDNEVLGISHALGVAAILGGVYLINRPAPVQQAGSRNIEHAQEENSQE